MKQLFRDGLKFACLSLILLNPNNVSASGVSAADAAAGIGLEEEASTKAPCPYTTAADIPEGVQEYVATHLMDIGLESSLKIITCVSQLNPALFLEAWDEMQTHLDSLGTGGRLELAEKIDNTAVRLFLGFETEDKADGDADRVAYLLDTFFQHNTGREPEILAEVDALEKQIAGEADEDACALLKSQLGILGKRLHAANHPESRNLPGDLFFDPYLLHGDNQSAILEIAFMKVAATQTDAQLVAFDEASTKINETNAYIANMLILLKATYQAGDVALSWILQAGDDVTAEQANRYMKLSNFYHDYYGRFIGQSADSEGLIIARENFVEIIRGLTFVHDVPAGDDVGASDGKAEEGQDFPAPVFVTVPSGDEAADAVAEESIAASESKLVATAHLQAEMEGIPAQLETITARRTAAGDDAAALAAVEADKAAIIARLGAIQAELLAL